MKKTIIMLCGIILPFIINAQSIENGIVKEYQGKKEKTVLPGVELMVNGAPSTISDHKGEFSLRFATLKPGEKISYSEIYKDGFVIFNKDAIDSWRISNKGLPFTIIMCKESEFRTLKKKYYGILEKSYYNEYIKQCEKAKATASNELELKRKLETQEKLYNEKMSNINTYVDLFSRIDQSEMNSTESKALDYLEAGEIDEAIKAYEELQLKQCMESQFSKLDAADQMKSAYLKMESDAQSDLILLVDKMQKQISLYEMGGDDYDLQRYDMMDNLATLLYRLRPTVGNKYDELLGTTLTRRAHGLPYKKHLEYFRKAACLPSISGLLSLAKAFEYLPPSKENIDSIRLFYARSLELIDYYENKDSIKSLISSRIEKIPEGYFVNTDGNFYPYRILNNGDAELMGQGPYYSAILSGKVVLPEAINIDGEEHKIVGIGNFAFGRNPNLQKVTLPTHCKYVGKDAFYGCDSLLVCINAELDSIYTNYDGPAFPNYVKLEFLETPNNIEGKLNRNKTYDMNYSKKDNTKPTSIVKPSAISHTSSEDDSIVAKKRLMKEWVQIIQNRARKEWQYLYRLDNLRGPDYEELVSIGIIAVNAMTKNKTLDQLAKYNSKGYLDPAVKWAIRNELSYRYEWYNSICSQYDLYESERSTEEMRMVEGIKEAVKTMPQEYVECFNYFKLHKKFSKKFSKETIQGMFLYIKNYLKENGYTQEEMSE